MTDLYIPVRKRTIIVVDDNPDLVEIVRLMLEAKGFKVRCAYSGPQLFASLEAQKPDLILHDVMMPEMDGLHVLAQLQWNPGTSSIPVILLTAKVLREDIELGYKMGTDQYIKKPFDSTQLMTSVNRLLGLPDTPPSQPIASS